ncbi:HAMP domain-containing histidine kinase [Shewanella sp.]|nr:HAMP domain-containing histidine kinase [Shewanella sp.]
MKSIGSQLQRLFLLFSFFLTSLLIAITIFYAYMIEDNIFNEQLYSEAKYIQSQYQAQGEIASPRYPYMYLVSRWQDLSADIVVQQSDEPNRVEYTLPDGIDIHVFPFRLDEKKQVILVSKVSGLGVNDRSWPLVIPLFLIFVLMLIAVGSWLVYRFIRNITAPLNRLSEIMFNIQSLDELPLGFTDTFPDNEVRSLAGSLKKLLERLHLTLDREKQFTRDISHELRTPVTILKNALRECNEQKLLPSKYSQQLNKAAEQQHQILNVLTTLAREESSQKKRVKLLIAIERSVLSLPGLQNQEDFNIDIQVLAKTRILASPVLLKLLLNNLIINAVKHAGEKRLQISWQGNELQFKNPVNEPVPLNVTQARVKGKASDGIGQGLNLVQRIVQFHDGALELRNQQEGQRHFFIVAIAMPLTD